MRLLDLRCGQYVIIGSKEYRHICCCEDECGEGKDYHDLTHLVQKNGGRWKLKE